MNPNRPKLHGGGSSRFRCRTAVFERTDRALGTASEPRGVEEVREMMEIAESFDRVSDRVEYMCGLGLDYERTSKYLPIVESLNRRVLSPKSGGGSPRKWWESVYNVVMFTVGVLSSFDCRR